MAIQQHPIPQNVTSYQFRLVGDMTLKQFFELAGGIIVGLIFYALGLPALFKWPLVGLSVGLGAGMAFLPVGGRTLDQWLLAFFRSIYQPTVFTWKKTAEPVSVITPTKTLPPTQLTKIVPAVAAPEAASVSFSGVLLEALEKFYPEVLASFQKLVTTGKIEILSETYYHSLSFLYSLEQVQFSF